MTDQPISLGPLRDFTRHVDIYRELAAKECPHCQEPRKGMMLCEGTWIDCHCLKRERPARHGPRSDHASHGLT